MSNSNIYVRDREPTGLLSFIFEKNIVSTIQQGVPVPMGYIPRYMCAYLNELHIPVTFDI